MTLKDLREIYERSSSKASDINRKLIFAGIAIVWIFRISEDGNTMIPENLKSVLLLFCISLSLDVLQYLVRGVMWHMYYYFKRDPKKEENQMQAEEPEWLNSFPDSLWYSKFVPTLVAYLGLAEYLSIASLGDSKFFLALSSWKVVYVVGIIFGIIMMWYVATELIQRKKGITTNNSSVCICVRTSFAIFMFIVCTVKLFL